MSLTKGQTLTVMGTNNGIAPIPAFTLGKPAGLIFLKTNISKHLEFSPDVAFNATNGKLWFTDLWLRYNWWAKKDTTKKTVVTVGVDFPSYFGGTYMDQGKEISQLVVYYATQLKVKRFISKSLSVTADYWYSGPTEIKFGTKGHYLSISGEWEKELAKRYSFTINPNVFYLSYSDGTTGWAASTAVSIGHKKSGLFVGVSGLVPITSKQIKATWNISAGITRKIF